MKIKPVLAQVHLWIGLSLGILFFLVAFSGALYTWAPEFARIIYKEKVAPQEAPIMTPSALKATLEREFPSGDFRTVYYRGKNTSMQVLLYGNGTYYHASMDPYTGDLIHLQDMNKGWLNYLKFMHRNLILGKVGRKIVHWVTLLFLIMIITGMVLWWPVNKKGRKQRLTIKWGVSPQKLNYDLHNVLGFYASWILIFSVITGLFWGFEVVRNSLKAVTGETEIVYDKPLSAVMPDTEKTDPFPLMDSIMVDFRQRYPGKNIRVSNPHQPDEPINVSVIDPSTAGYLTDHYHLDRYTGQVLSGHFENGPHAEASTFHTLHALVYDVHFGTVWGLPGRLLVFFASLIAASLPITGFIVWWNRRKSN